ncbi:hypothetical protein JMJ55_18750 [Belnapia sp. T6]|uniref:Uncharacterized protein n=1 Tax=Belnapia mucosa TaxID=2804532 RepID=A0ABS1V6S5_9PROT|nr:hypothetical protein [Belnapia mucosa]MBL6457378.1 hypothetical protein [Belnapia mucosa]
MNQPDASLTPPERHIRDGEESIARLIAIAEAMERDNHPYAADRARRVLATLQSSLDLAREYLRLEREERGLEP